eukprot:3066625-Pyramimonas_sp.AAC.1
MNDEITTKSLPLHFAPPSRRSDCRRLARRRGRCVDCVPPLPPPSSLHLSPLRVITNPSPHAPSPPPPPSSRVG